MLYGVILVLSLLFSLFLIWRLYKTSLVFLRFKITLDEFFDSTLVFLLSFGIGARLLFVVKYWGLFTKSIFDWVLFLHVPGFSFLGGVIGGILGLWLFCLHKRKPYFLFLDLILVGLAFAYAISRIGSLIAGEPYGRILAYEVILSIVIALVIYYVYSKGKEKPGVLSLYFLFLIGLSSFFIELQHNDSVYLGVSSTFISIGIVGIIFINLDRIRLLIKRKLHDKNSQT